MRRDTLIDEGPPTIVDEGDAVLTFEEYVRAVAPELDPSHKAGRCSADSSASSPRAGTDS